MTLLESQKTKSEKEKAKTLRTSARNRIVNCADLLQELPGMDVLVVARNKWQGGQEHWIYNSIDTEENQWDLDLTDFVNHPF